jgi:hypothetical protein
MKLSCSTGLTAAETKQCADQLLKTTKSTAIPATGPLNYERDGFVSLCSPAGEYNEEGFGPQRWDSRSSMLGVRARRCTLTRLCLRITCVLVLSWLEVCRSVSSYLTFENQKSLVLGSLSNTDCRLQCNVECRSLQHASTDLAPAPEMATRCRRSSGLLHTCTRCHGSVKLKLEKGALNLEDAVVKMEDAHADDGDGCEPFQYMSQEGCASADFPAKPSKKTKRWLPRLHRHASLSPALPPRPRLSRLRCLSRSLAPV